MNRLLQQVAGILAADGVEFDVSDSRDALFVTVDSAILLVSGHDDDHPRIEIISWLLTDLELDPANERAIHERLNDLNFRWLYPRFCLVGEMDAITMSYEFPAGDLRPDDFLSVLGHLAAMAETTDDELQADFGGNRAMDFTAEEMEEMAARDGAAATRAEPPEATSRLKKIFGR
jgi:Putative bacterial sensory transduction regulator